MSKSFLVTVTNDLNQDQRMHRICDSLVADGHAVLLLGRKKRDSNDLLNQKFQQKRLDCFFTKGILFYLEFNLRILLFTLRYKPDIVYAVDLDTLAGLGSAAKFLGKKLIHDAHEYFVEVPELEGKNVKKWVWNSVGKIFIPKCDLCLTVNEELEEILSKKYANVFHAIKSVPPLSKFQGRKEKEIDSTVILYQGVLNKGRGLEESIRAIHALEEDLVFNIVGEGDLSAELRKLTNDLNAHNKIKFLGWKNPDELKKETQKADIGLNLLTASSLNYKYSLANKFFDYMHAEIPSINMNFPVYERICASYKVGLCIESLNQETIQNAIKRIIGDKELRSRMKIACREGRAEYNWDNESKKLSALIKQIL